ncbi:MAG TPA: GNAT family protein [Methanomassiliicoccaceae archaeon]|jgi:RimJ/RimL family protein N-acetyltransferase|nr:GNAT family protein [Methanomassiliicoccaceae archaeon]
MVSGEDIHLRSLRTEDVWLMYRWYNDPRVMEDMTPRQELFAPSVEEIRLALEQAVASTTERYFVIQDGAGRALGFTSLTSMDMRAASARLTVVIGDRNDWGKGLGKEATKRMIDYAFNVLNLHRVYAIVADHNLRAISCLEACGFVHEGTLRDDHYRRGAYRSSHIMSVLRDEGFTC